MTIKMMDKNRLAAHVNLLLERYPALSGIRKQIEDGYLAIEECYRSGGKLVVAGNGGSAADAEHIVGELMKGFKLPRKLGREYADRLLNVDADMGRTLANRLQGTLPAIALDGHPALTTAYMNDCDPMLCFAQQISGYGSEGDVFLAISTSGNSRNILYAVTVARANGLKVVGLTGASSSRLSELADVCIQAVSYTHLDVYKRQP